MNQYQVKVKHDKGIINFTISAGSFQSARQNIMKAEGCPECAIVQVTLTKVFW